MSTKYQLLILTLLLAVSTFGCYFKVTDENDEDASGNKKEIVSEKFMLTCPPSMERR